MTVQVCTSTKSSVVSGCLHERSQSIPVVLHQPRHTLIGPLSAPPTASTASTAPAEAWSNDPRKKASQASRDAREFWWMLLKTMQCHHGYVVSRKQEGLVHFQHGWYQFSNSNFLGSEESSSCRHLQYSLIRENLYKDLGSLIVRQMSAMLIHLWASFKCFTDPRFQGGKFQGSKTMASKLSPICT